MKRYFLVVLTLVALLACERPKSAGENNVIKDYVETPKEQAMDVKQKVEAKQNSAAEQAKQALHDNGDSDDEGEGEESEDAED